MDKLRIDKWLWAPEFDTKWRKWLIHIGSGGLPATTRGSFVFLGLVFLGLVLQIQQLAEC